MDNEQFYKFISRWNIADLIKFTIDDDQDFYAIVAKQHIGKVPSYTLMLLAGHGTTIHPEHPNTFLLQTGTAIAEMIVPSMSSSKIVSALQVESFALPEIRYTKLESNAETLSRFSDPFVAHYSWLYRVACGINDLSPALDEVVRLISTPLFNGSLATIADSDGWKYGGATVVNKLYRITGITYHLRKMPTYTLKKIDVSDDEENPRVRYGMLTGLDDIIIDETFLL